MRRQEVTLFPKVIAFHQGSSVLTHWSDYLVHGDKGMPLPGPSSSSSLGVTIVSRNLTHQTHGFGLTSLIFEGIRSCSVVDQGFRALDL